MATIQGALLVGCMDRTHGGQVYGDMVDTFRQIICREFDHALEHERRHELETRVRLFSPAAQHQYP